jgi:hypothetical protein
MKQSFCVDGEFNRTFSVNAIDWMQTNGFLCNNLSASDLKSFLISVQEQLDNSFIVKETNVVFLLFNQFILLF